mgnify:CR=1 FL=1
MKSFLSLILEDETGIPWGKYDNEGNPRQGDLFKGKYVDPKTAKTNWDAYVRALGPNVDPKNTKLPNAEALEDMLTKNRGQVAKEMRSAAKANLIPDDIAKLKRLEDMPGMQRSMGILGPEDLNSALRQAKFDKWGSRSHVTPTRASAAGSQGAVKSGSLQGTPKPAPRTPLLFAPETHLGGRPTSGSMQSMKPKGPGLPTKFVRAGRAVLRNPITRIGGKALGGAVTLLAPAIHVADAEAHADKVTKREFDDIAAAKERGKNPYSAKETTDRAFRQFVGQGSKFR